MLGIGKKKRPTPDNDELLRDTPPLDPAQLIEVMQCFPIGGKIRFFPDDKEELAMDSIVIAYGINDYLIYTQNDIRVHLDEREQVFLIDDNWKDKVVRKVHSFCMLIPHIIEEDNELSYPRKVELLNESRFARDRAITLMSLLNDRGVPHVRTRVRKRVVMSSGYYANHPVVVLEVTPATLTLVDQRQQRRLRTMIPVRLELLDGTDSLPCTLIDFSESCVRIKGDRESQFFSKLYEDQSVVLHINLERHQHHFVFRGKILRRDEEFIVLELAAINKQGRFTGLSMLDVFEFKAKLLQHPETQ